MNVTVKQQEMENFQIQRVQVLVTKYRSILAHR